MNYLYFGIYFLLLSLMSASGIFIKEPFKASQMFFFLYAVGQAALETFLLIFFSLLFQRFGNKTLFLGFIWATFLLVILHLLDCIMEKILDISVFSAISLFVLNETFSNFLQLLSASGIPIWGWLLLLITFISLPFLGVILYRYTEKFTKKHPLPITFESSALCIFSLLAALFFWDFSASPLIHPNTYTAFRQSLPWKSTLLHPQNITFQTPHFSNPPDEASISKEILQTNFPLQTKPNIYLFIIESFRDDFITKEIAPHLYAFKQQALPIQTTLSNGNASHLSWFSIFHSQFALYWNLLQQNTWEMGSPPLHLLKNLGYQIRLYSSADLEYYKTQELLFGKNNFLLNSHQKFPHIGSISAAETDANAMSALKKDLTQNPSLHQGQLFITFLDSTHFDYQWGKTHSPQFTPFAGSLTYIKMFYSRHRINLIKNRYKNAVHYIDTLFGKFLETIPNKEEAIILVTGDHGEEFFEKGHLFHGSHLVEEQTRVPILMKFGERTLAKTRTLASQMDIFPTLLDHLCGKTPSFLQGQSVFHPPKRSFELISRFNAGQTPYEFCLHNGQNKCIIQFGNTTNILSSSSIQIKSLQSFNDQNLPESYPDVRAWIQKEFGSAFESLFQNP